MERLTTDSPQGNFETILNYVYGRDGWAMLRSDGEHDNVPLTEWARRQCKCRGCDVEAGEGPEEIDQAICDCTFLQPDCPVFLAYTFASQAVHLRSRLAAYEDICFDATGKERITVEELSTLVKAQDEGRVLPYGSGWFVTSNGKKLTVIMDINAARGAEAALGGGGDGV